MPLPQIVNLQRKIKIDVDGLERFNGELQTAVSEVNGRHFSTAFVNDVRMRQLNETFRGKAGTTDVLSFPREPDAFDPNKDDLGDIVISAEQAQRQAKTNGLSLETEFKQLILHGALHLCGFDHETDDGEMNARELELRRMLGIE
jgi:probable rRNA maturation factor